MSSLAVGCEKKKKEEEGRKEEEEMQQIISPRPACDRTIVLIIKIVILSFF
jgi:hypothetical protein